MSEADKEKIHAEAHASVVMETLASESFVEVAFLS